MKPRNGIKGLMALVLGFGGLNCTPQGFTPGIPNDILNGETLTVYEEDLKEGFNSETQYNFFSGAPAIQSGAIPIILPSREFSVTPFNAPFSVHFEPREGSATIPGVYSEWNLKWEDTDNDLFENGTSYTVWIPSANNAGANPFDFLSVNYHKGHSPEYITTHPEMFQGSAGADGQDGTPCWDTNGNGINDPSEDVNGDNLWNALDCQGSSSGGTVDPCTSVSLEEALTGTYTAFVDENDNSVDGLQVYEPFRLRHYETPSLNDCYSTGIFSKITELGNNPEVGLVFDPDKLIDHSTGSDGRKIWTVKADYLGEWIVGGEQKAVYETRGVSVWTGLGSPYEMVQGDSVVGTSDGSVYEFSDSELVGN